MSTPTPETPDTPGKAVATLNLQGAVVYARALSDSNMLPAQYRGKPANVLWALEYGRTLGLTTMAAITGVHVIEGKPSASSGLIGALVRRAGHKLRVRTEGTGNAVKAIAEIVRADDPDYTYRSEWTLTRANQAGLTGKKVWQQYPQAMLKARAISEVARDACEEVLYGLHYTPEELGLDVDDDGRPLPGQVEAEVVQEPQADPQAFADTASTLPTVEALRGLWKDANQARVIGHPVQVPVEQAQAAGIEPADTVTVQAWIEACVTVLQSHGRPVSEVVATPGEHDPWAADGQVEAEVVQEQGAAA